MNKIYALTLICTLHLGMHAMQNTSPQDWSFGSYLHNNPVVSYGSYAWEWLKNRTIQTSESVRRIDYHNKAGQVLAFAQQKGSGTLDTTSAAYRQVSQKVSQFVQQRPVVKAVGKVAGNVVSIGTLVYCYPHIFFPAATVTYLVYANRDTVKSFLAPPIDFVTTVAGQTVQREWVAPVKRDIKEGSSSVLTKTVGGTLLLIGAFFGARLAAQEIDRRFNSPQLTYTIMREPVSKVMRAPGQSPFAQLVFSHEVTDRLKEIAENTIHIQSKILEGDQNATYRGLLLCGPHGSGKQLIARSLAQYAGMDFIDLSASSITRYKDDRDINSAHEAFFKGVAGKSPNGAIVFINNAEMLLRKATDSTPFGKSVNSFIEYATKGAKNFMIVLSVHGDEKPTLTPAMASLVPDIVQITQPDQAQRITILEMYRNKFFSGSDTSDACAASALQCLNGDKIKEIAEKLDGIPAKELYELIKSIKSAAERSVDDQVSSYMVNSIVKDKVEWLNSVKK